MHKKSFTVAQLAEMTQSEVLGDPDPEVRAQATEAARILSGPEASDSPVRKALKTERNLEVHCHIGLNMGEVALGAMGRGVNTGGGAAVHVTCRSESRRRRGGGPVLEG